MITQQNPFFAWASSIRVLAPLTGKPLAQFLSDQRETVAPFSDCLIHAVSALSEDLLRSPTLKQDPASVAVGFWLRRSNLLRLQAAHQAKTAMRKDILWIPVGRVFHVAPSNVDTLFLYSWAISFLCGNQNVVRVSSQPSPLVMALLESIDKAASRHPILGNSNRFLTYDHDTEISSGLSCWCNHRIVWGGNETVAAIRSIPLNPHASERSFSSKFSYVMIKASAYLSASSEARRSLASAFFNDMFWFDQAACSSPQVLFWVGTEEDIKSVYDTFLDALQRECQARSYDPLMALASKRLTEAFDLAARNEVRVDFTRSALTSIHFLSAAPIEKELYGGGILRIIPIPHVDRILPYLDEGDQTLTYYGFAPDELNEFAVLAGNLGIDRVLPIGEALNFDVIWDGFDLIDDCLRRVTLR